MGQRWDVFNHKLTRSKFLLSNSLFVVLLLGFLVNLQFFKSWLQQKYHYWAFHAIVITAYSAGKFERQVVIAFRFVSDWVRGWREYSGPITERLKVARYGTKLELCKGFLMSLIVIHCYIIGRSNKFILIRTNLSSFSTYMKLNELLLTTKNKIKTKKEKTSILKQNVNIEVPRCLLHWLATVS